MVQNLKTFEELALYTIKHCKGIENSGLFNKIEETRELTKRSTYIEMVLSNKRLTLGVIKW